MSYPIIGSKYVGPPLDRPALRRLPDGWQLENAPEEMSGLEVCIIAAVALLALWILVILVFSLRAP